MSTLITVDIASDIICPWCYIGQARLDKAMILAKERTPGVEFQVVWHPFMLKPGMDPSPGNPKVEGYLKMFGGDKRKLKAMTDRMASMFDGEGLVYNFSGNVSNTIDAHRLLEYTKLHHGAVVQNELHRMLFKMYHSEGADPGDKAMLCMAAGSVGLDTDVVKAFLDGKELYEEVFAASSQRGMRNGFQQAITGVPHFRFSVVNSAGDTIGAEVGGAQDPAALVTVVDQVQRRLAKNP